MYLCSHAAYSPRGPKFGAPHPLASWRNKLTRTPQPALDEEGLLPFAEELSVARHAVEGTGVNNRLRVCALLHDDVLHLRSRASCHSHSPERRASSSLGSQRQGTHVHAGELLLELKSLDPADARRHASQQLSFEFSTEVRGGEGRADARARRGRLKGNAHVHVHDVSAQARNREHETATYRHPG
eukprot:2535121-Pleurochrysis_carterae.AAC.2